MNDSKLTVGKIVDLNTAKKLTASETTALIDFLRRKAPMSKNEKISEAAKRAADEIWSQINDLPLSLLDLIRPYLLRRIQQAIDEHVKEKG